MNTEPQLPAVMITKAAEAAVEAGKVILDIYSKGFRVRIKSDWTPVTNADRAAHEVILDHLKEIGLPCLSEEGRNIPWKERNAWESYWLIDPLDGTREFINRNGEFTVNIALMKDDMPVGGVIYIPLRDQLFYALKGKGAYKMDKATGTFASGLDFGQGTSGKQSVHIRVRRRDSRHLTVVASRSHINKATRKYIDKLREEYEDVEILSAGSSIKICMIAEGLADLYPRFGPTSEWDTAAGQAIVEAAGGFVFQASSGKRLAYNKENLLNPDFIVSSYEPGMAGLPL